MSPRESRIQTGLIPTGIRHGNDKNPDLP